MRCHSKTQNAQNNTNANTTANTKKNIAERLKNDITHYHQRRKINSENKKENI